MKGVFCFSNKFSMTYDRGLGRIQAFMMNTQCNKAGWLYKLPQLGIGNRIILLLIDLENICSRLVGAISFMTYVRGLIKIFRTDFL